MNRIKVYADFNGIFGELLCLSHTESSKDEFGNIIKLYEGMEITAYDEDADENDNRDYLIANGTVESSPDWLKCNGSKWCLRIDENGICHESDLREKLKLNQHFLHNLYDAFNKREIETVLSMMDENVKWANGMEGGFVFGRENVREYWRRQFELVNPQLETLQFKVDDENREVVTLRQIVRDFDGNVLIDKTVEHIFSFENGLIKVFEIGGFTKPFAENENFPSLKNNPKKQND